MPNPTFDWNSPADVVAPLLLGAVLRHGPVAIRITEVEAYLGEADPASHAANGPTPRCRTMFGPPGHLYVYASYGIHRAGNVVCSPAGTASAVLLRSGEVVDGYDATRTRRGLTCPDAGLARGPGNLGRALGLDLHLDGATIALAAPSEVTYGSTTTGLPAPSGDEASTAFELSLPGSPIPYQTGPRVGITKNAEAPLRFWIPGNPTVSRRR
ncbi:DNA-3-methyladenine glycosylase [Corynebacterium heidelbergense]|uniref:Putative 3-methyladenine DNA glycosylase n=1 Tax=Corynebacterium heidelbergense TaxID=2055947 RepID=A0A364VA00_9CORY|nr:DNA-3-methyladenine glycosylase [Corynebacterium heidelbergense]RAV33482.1 3-methyladenine DNA glycosylase [Corynebacterium heidelbergense]WCZ35648.1 3-methyladenine DNA glycosylase [Corynebacterium heidelbergense]